ncbi:MAG: hypothetical protein ACRCX2_01400 [Paraclostridium sp.]
MKFVLSELELIGLGIDNKTIENLKNTGYNRCYAYVNEEDLIASAEKYFYIDRERQYDTDLATHLVRQLLCAGVIDIPIDATLKLADDELEWRIKESNDEVATAIFEPINNYFLKLEEMRNA